MIAPARCEPPEHLRDRDGWHTVAAPDGTESHAWWVAKGEKWWTIATATPCGPVHMGKFRIYRYLHPVSQHDPADVERLVAAGKAVDRFMLVISSAVQFDPSARDHGDAIALALLSNAAALAPFQKETTDGQ